MKYQHLFHGATIASVALAMVACTSNNQQLGADFNDQDNDTALIISGTVVTDMIQNISSPVEMANEIKGTGVAFAQSMLNPAGKESQYETSFKKAANLGVYAADLGYINTFNKNTVVVDYLSSIKRLADGIGVGQFLDFSTLTRLAKNSTNLDSLKQLSVTSFNDIDKYLRENNRSNVSTAIVAGTWIEGLYITSNVVAQTNNEGLRNRLGEQKDIVGIMEIVVKTYAASDSEYKGLSKLISELKDIYEGVHITIEKGQPITKEVDGMLVIEMTDITTVEINDQQVKDIIAKVNEVRNYIAK